MSADLSSRDRALLAFTRASELLPHDGYRERIGRQLLGMTETRTWQRLNVLLGDPAAAAAYPQFINRRRRLRDVRRTPKPRRRVRAA